MSTQRPPAGPRPIQRADGTTTYSTGAIHTLILRVADRLRAQHVTADATPTSLPAHDIHTIQQHAEAALRG